MNKAIAYALAFIILSPIAVYADLPIKGHVLRPGLVPAASAGCKIAESGTYDVKVGDLIELDYEYPAANPTPSVDYLLDLLGHIVPSDLGIRRVSTPQLPGIRRIAFFFTAKTVGEERVSLIVDKHEYKYKFRVK
jgi:hypothetical protein